MFIAIEREKRTGACDKYYEVLNFCVEAVKKVSPSLNIDDIRCCKADNRSRVLLRARRRAWRGYNRDIHRDDASARPGCPANDTPIRKDPAHAPYQRRIDSLQRARTVKRQRQDDTRQKVLVGALVILRAQKDPAYKADLGRMLDQALTRPDDRALFGLDTKASQ